MRCFISIELPEEIKNKIDALTASLRESGADVKWVPAENLHLTIKFLGDTSEDLISEIKKRLSAIADSYKSSRVSLAGTGVFPDKKRPRVVWIGITGQGNLLELQKAVDGAMAPLGYRPEERPFKAHLTIGRVRSLRGVDDMLRELDILKARHFGDIEIHAVSLMKSELGPKGSKYIRLFDAPLVS